VLGDGPCRERVEDLVGIAEDGEQIGELGRAKGRVQSASMRSESVRRAVREDVPAIAAVLADAFADYPWTRWTVDAIDHRARVESLQELALLDLVLPYGEAWVHDDPAAGIVSAALWMLPGIAVPTAITERVQLRAAELEGDRHAASVEAEARLGPLRPTAPHLYLGAVGTKPTRQGSGSGSAVLRPVLARARREAVDVFLETSSEANVGFYAQLGFSVVHHVEVRDGGPDVWAMILTTRPAP